MDNNENKSESAKQPANETIDRLSFTIQRQSAMCLEFVQHAVEAERGRCAEIADAEAAALSGDSVTVAERIAERIRARSETRLITTVAIRSAG